MLHNRAQAGAWSIEAVAEVLEQSGETSPDEAKATAMRLGNIFGDETTIEDTEVESDERAFLWNMMLEGLVTVETQHRPHPEHGRTWRYFYWHLVPPQRLLEEETEEDEEEETVYDELPQDVWRRAAA